MASVRLVERGSTVAAVTFIITLFLVGYGVAVKAAGVPDGFPLAELLGQVSRWLLPQRHARRLATRIMRAVNRDVVVGVRGDVLVPDRILVQLSDTDHASIAAITDWFCADVAGAIEADANKRGRKLHGPVRVAVERSGLAMNGHPDVIATFGVVARTVIDAGAGRLGGGGGARTEIAAALLRFGERTVVVPASGSVTVGRGDDCELRVDDPMVSHRHLIVRDTASGVVVEDLGSSNGTWVNEQRVKVTRCVDGDVIRAGQRRLTVQMAQRPDELPATQRLP